MFMHLGDDGGEDARQLAMQQEVQNLTLLMCAYEEHVKDSPNTNLHPAPALGRVLMNQVSAILGTTLTSEMIEEMPDDLGELLVTRLSIFATNVFAFAQWCVGQGMLAANLTPCSCGQVSDEEIQVFINGQ